MTSLHLRTTDRSPDLSTLDALGIDDIHQPFGGIRCPLCAWRPSASSLWLCDCHGTPEPKFTACGARWNTFATHGRCPGCSHRWQWTTCLRCLQPSPHDDWYERDDDER